MVRASEPGVTVSIGPVAATALPSLPNMRDLASACPRVEPGRVLRCARPAEASEDDVRVLYEDLGVHDLVDLRGVEELAEDDAAASPLFSRSALLPYRRSWLTGQVHPDAAPIPSPSGAGTGAGPGDGAGPRFVRHNISLLERGRYYTGLLSHVPIQSVAKAMLYGLYDREASRLVLLQHVNQGGLLLLYKILVDGARPELAAVLGVVTRALEQDRCVMFFCKAGKDRTGLVAALVLACAGASDDEIVADYVRSDAYHKMALAGIENKKELQGLDRAQFERAPEEAMRGLLHYVRATYGGLLEYMEAIGFSRTQQSRLGHLLKRKRYRTPSQPSSPAGSPPPATRGQ